MHLNIFFILIMSYGVTPQNHEDLFKELQGYASSLIELESIRIDEELNPNTQVANLTKLVYTRLFNLTHLDNINFTSFANFVHINSIRFDDSFQDSSNSFFLISLRQIHFENYMSNSIDLRTAKSIDRESLCAGLTDVCHLKIILNSNLIIAPERSFNMKFKLIIDLADLNDNAPAFYQDNIQLEIDMDKTAAEDMNSFLFEKDIVKIPLKIGFDLDSTETNRIQNYTLKYLKEQEKNDLLFEKLNFMTLVYPNRSNLFICINTSNTFKKMLHERIKNNGSNVLFKRFELAASDGVHQAIQHIFISFKMKKQSSLAVINSAIFEKNFYNITKFNLSNSSKYLLLQLAIRSFELNKCLPKTLTFSIVGRLVETNPWLKNIIFSYASKSKTVNLEIMNFKLSTISKWFSGPDNQFQIKALCNSQDHGLINDTALVIVNLIQVSDRGVIKNYNDVRYFCIFINLTKLII